MVKLIIWDLDDTLWHGTLAEGDDVSLFDERIHAIRLLNSQGVVNSICSKNDFETAKAKLTELGIFQEFVFPEINFVAKGQSVQRILTDMNLRAPDVVFVDDNPHNLHEVESVVEGIQTIDANSLELDRFLLTTLAETAGGKSRVSKYRMMEDKRSARAELEGSNEDFLRSSGIKMTVVRTQENAPYAGRIEELINRTNQLNFLKTRVEPGSLAPFIVDVGKNQTYSLFVWDKFGNYGLVGFAFVRTNTKEVRHFTFSCRIMNMGVEEQFAWYLHAAPDGPRVPLDKLPVAAINHDWITIVDSNSEEARAAVAEASGTSGASAAEIRVMANCQSGSIAHYLQVDTPVEIDNWPQAFRLVDWIRDQDMRGPWTPHMVYGAFVDYSEDKWRGTEGLAEYTSAVKRFARECVSRGSSLTVILPVDQSVNSSGVTYDYSGLNKAWRDIAGNEPAIEVLELSDFNPAMGADPRHFTRETIIAIADALTTKFRSVS